MVVYGLHSIVDRKALWSGLMQHVHWLVPLMVIGDFNSVCHLDDRLNGTLITDAEIRDFMEFLLSSSLIEAKSSGLFYSWSNSSTREEIIMRRIDKEFVNQA